jgi:hypothetical protein
MRNIKYRIDTNCSYKLFKNTNMNDVCRFLLKTTIQTIIRTDVNRYTAINTMIPINTNMNNISPFQRKRND